jgi:Tfp pilus assembly protein PilO
MNVRSAQATVLLGALGLALLAALGWVGLVGPALGDVGAADDARTQTQDANQAKRVELARLRRESEDLPTTDALAAELDAIFPATADQPGLFAEVSRVARAAGVAPDDVTGLTAGAPVILGEDPAAPPAAPTDTPTVHDPTETALQTVTVVVRGDYGELSRVLRGLEEMPRAFLVASADITAEEDDVLTLTVVGATFVAPPLEPDGS